MSNQRNKVVSLPVIEPDAAGIDVGATEIFVAVPADRDPEPIRCFPTFTVDLERLTDWLQRCRIRTVAMESTGVYWIPLFQILEKRKIDVRLVNAHHVKNVPGSKTDVSDCQWIQHLHSVGLLRGSFRPDDEICAIRSLWRHRGNLIQLATLHFQHMQKALDQPGSPRGQVFVRGGGDESANSSRHQRSRSNHRPGHHGRNPGRRTRSA